MDMRVTNYPLLVSSRKARYMLLLTAFFIILMMALGIASPARAATAGTLDPTFSGDGKTTTTIDEDDDATAVAVQSDSKIVSVGGAAAVHDTPSTVAVTSDFAVTRHNPDGTLDASFGGDGKVTTKFGAFDFGAYRYSRAEDVVIQPDGKIVVAGWTGSSGDSLRNGNFALARYNPDGSLDTSFGGVGGPFGPPTEGTVEDDFGGYNEGAFSLALQSDGKILAAGDGPNGWAVARYMPDGSGDNTFGVDGHIVARANSEEYSLHDVALQSDGKIVAVGTVGYNDPRFSIHRFNTNGAMDTSFGGGAGKVATNFSRFDDYAETVVIQPDGKIVVAGLQDLTGNAGLARYTSSGSLDSTFGGGDGKVAEADGSGWPLDMAFQPNGKFVIAGGSFVAPEKFIVSRYNANGSIDTGFGSKGNVLPSFNSTNEAIGRGVAIQPDGKVVAVGYARNNVAETDFALARFEGKTPPDTTAPKGTIKINGGRAYTKSPSVNLSLSATDPDSGLASMRFKNDGGNWTPWMRYATSKSWTLRNANGTRTVYAQYKDKAGNGSTTALDRIMLDTVKPRISGMTPKHRSITRDTTPTIAATVKDSATNLRKSNIKLYVAGKRIANGKFSYNSRDRLVYKSPKLSKGKKVVKIVARDSAGNVGAKSWYFTIR